MFSFVLLTMKRDKFKYVTFRRISIKDIVKTQLAQKYRPLINVSDWELLQSIACNDSAQAELAYMEFYYRYSSHTLNVCRKSCYAFDSSNLLADDIFQNTLLKILYKAHTFKLKNPQEKTNISNEIKGWVSRIAKNELINFLRQNPDEKRLSDPFRIRTFEIEDNEPLLINNEGENIIEIQPPSINQIHLDKALTTLSERERYILMTYMQFYNPMEPDKHLPDDVLSSICNKFNIKPDNIRQIKGRALKKLKEEINQIKVEFNR